MLNLDNEYIQHHDRIHQTIITKHSSDSHNILTPLELCDEIISKVHNQNNFKSNTKVLILCNIEFIKVLQLLYNSLNINMDNVYFVTVCSTKAKLVRQTGSNIIVYKSYKDFFEDNDLPKFDVVIGNPPYNSNIHLKFLKKAYDISDGIVKLVHPGSWLYISKSGTSFNKSQYIKNYINGHVKSLEFINGNKIFDIKLWGPCVISTLDTRKIFTKIEVINSLNDTSYISTNLNLNPFISEHTLFDSIKLKIKTLIDTDNFKNHLELKHLKYYMSLPCMTGNNNKDTIVDKSFSEFSYNDNITSIKISNKGNKWKWISFETEKEIKNCKNYLSGVFARYCLRIIKIDHHLDSKELSYIPFLDFTKEWPDSKIYKKLNLTQEEIQYIEDHV